MQVVSYTRYVRVSPKKIKFLIRGIKGMKPKDALTRLTFMKEKTTHILAKAIKTALSDAVNNYKLLEDNLVFVSIETGKGPMLKRWQPVARGMAHQIKKRTSNLKIVLEEKKTEKVPTEIQEGKIVKEEAVEAKKPEVIKEQPRSVKKERVKKA